MAFGVKGGYRFKNNNSGESRNIYGYLSYYNIPVIKTNATLAATYLESDYLTGKIFNVNLSRDLFKGKVYAYLGYQYVNYLFYGTTTPMEQNIVNLSLSMNVIKNLTLSVNIEETLEKQDQLSRIMLQVKKRF